MRTTTTLFFGVLFYSALCYWSCDSSPSLSSFRVDLSPSLEALTSEQREQWLDRMHRRPPGVDWRKIEHENRKHLAALSSGLRNNCGPGSFAQGHIDGQWIERGSRNQAGSILDINYLPEEDQIWAISAGGSLWKRSRTINDWQIINQKVRLNRGFLEFIPMEAGHRLLAFINNQLHFSDDAGQHWSPSRMNTSPDAFKASYFGHPVLSQGEAGTIAFLSKPDYWSPLQLLFSRDNGHTLEILKTFNDHDLDNFELVANPLSDAIWLLQRSANGTLQVYDIDFENSRLQLLNPQGQFSAGDTYLEATFGYHKDSLALFTFIENSDAEQATYFYSTNQGRRWSKRSILPITPWPFTLHIDSKNPQIHYLGGVDAYQSTDGGKSWKIINYWWEYFEDINHYLHADIMQIRNFTSKEGQDFTLISNHGGLNISYDHFAQLENLGLDALNVSQYYSVRTHPREPMLIYAGSQDQGLQASLDEQTDSLLYFDQLIGGDYGHLSFSANGNSLWAVYPGGWVIFIKDSFNGQITASYELISQDETVWLPPLHASVTAGEKKAYLAGGHPGGNPGSYLITLSVQEGELRAETSSPDFLSESIDGTISAIEIAPADSNFFYLATTNGRFFYSWDGGQNWQQSLEFLPQGNYLYGQAIVAFSKNPRHLYLGGSGYAHPAVFFSDDGGKTFTDKSRGLPATLVYDLALDPSEQWLYAATEAGPFVLDISQNQWHYLGNSCTPDQTYWSVEFIASLNRVRFGTYGRGIWDFQINNNPSTSTEHHSINATGISIYPNPSRDFIRVKGIQKGSFCLLNSQGAVLKRGTFSAHQAISLVDLPAGIYFLQTLGSTISTHRLVKY